MSILIKGMEMPKTCHCCRMCVQVSDGDIDWHWECCLLCEKVERYATDRIPGCPLVPVPPHGRLIDADALRAKQQEDADLFQGSTAYCDKCRRDEAMNAVANIVIAPTIIPAEEGE